MGRTLPSTTMQFFQDIDSLKRFHRALRRSDQVLLDELLASAQKHLPAAGHAAHEFPFECVLLAMLIETHKELKQARELIKAVCDLADKNSQQTS